MAGEQQIVRRQYESDYGDRQLPGYRFCPTDLEIIWYLKRKINGTGQPPKCRLHEVDLYEHHPNVLTDEHRQSDLGFWYFLTSRERKHRNGNRPNRRTRDGLGFWKASQKATVVYDENKQAVGNRTSLAYHEGKNNKTSWLMHEYTTILPNLPAESNRKMLTEWVLCRVYNTDKDYQRSHQAEQVRKRIQEDVNEEQNRVHDDEPSSRRRRLSVNQETNQTNEPNHVQIGETIQTNEPNYVQVGETNQTKEPDHVQIQETNQHSRNDVQMVEPVNNNNARDILIIRMQTELDQNLGMNHIVPDPIVGDADLDSNYLQPSLLEAPNQVSARDQRLLEAPNYQVFAGDQQLLEAPTYQRFARDQQLLEAPNHQVFARDQQLLEAPTYQRFARDQQLLEAPNHQVFARDQQLLEAPNHQVFTSDQQLLEAPNHQVFTSDRQLLEAPTYQMFARDQQVHEPWNYYGNSIPLPSTSYGFHDDPTLAPLTYHEDPANFNQATSSIDNNIGLAEFPTTLMQIGDLDESFWSTSYLDTQRFDLFSEDSVECI